MTHPQPPRDPGGRYGHPGQSAYPPAPPPGYGPPQQQGHGQYRWGYPAPTPGHPVWGHPQGGGNSVRWGRGHPNAPATSSAQRS